LEKKTESEEEEDLEMENTSDVECRRKKKKILRCRRQVMENAKEEDIEDP